MTVALGCLVLVPNTLDFGTAQPLPPLEEVLPRGVIQRAAALAYWVTENAKTTRAFLNRVNAVLPLAQPLQALQIVELPRVQKGARVPMAGVDLSTLLAPALQGHALGLMSEAGLPAVADPGAALVQAAHAAGIRVEVLPGPSSLLLALAASGLNGQSFAFVGYLPIDGQERAARLCELEALSRRSAQTQLMIETPYRNAALLSAMLSHLQSTTRVSVGCGLTLASGFTRTDTVQGWRAQPIQLPADLPVVFSLLAQ